MPTACLPTTHTSSGQVRRYAGGGGGSLYSEVQVEQVINKGVREISLYSEVQCIMGNGTMGTPSSTQIDRQK